ncbi:hypothetical protein C8F04DRAFT_31471 [Mycena alexandri]|uniref:F-box domain-containing protein n=1 Tax=Mycena alexandri TaxID=1745969 RepID=A0AAD6TD62_9AGAR|nr:hypothetical protein C8F04DRAFT_31471 [Mycena alexandri]
MLPIGLGTDSRPSFASFPPEILLRILSNALPPWWLINAEKSDVGPTIRSTLDILMRDTRMKCSLVAVCKSWNQVATELLYERVTLRRIHQLALFVRALEMREGLSALVRHLHVDCFIPRGYSKFFATETRRILDLCPRLAHVGFSPVFWIPNLRCSLPAMNFPLTWLEFNHHVPHSVVLPALVQLAHSLVTLALSVPPMDTEYPVITFDRLEELRLTFHPSSSTTAKWRAPNLQRLCLGTPQVLFHDYSWQRIQMFAGALTEYGHLIRFLQIFNCDCVGLSELLNLVGMCPLLDHLVVFDYRYLDPLTAVFDQRIVVDVKLMVEVYPPVDILAHVEGSVFHSESHHGRIQCNGDGWTEWDWYPRRYGGTPDIMLAIMEFTPANSVNARMLTPRRGSMLPSHPDPFDSDDDDAESVTSNSDGDSWTTVTTDDDYESDSDTDDEGSVAYDSDDGSCITVSEDGEYINDEFYMTEEWELNHEEVLEIFHRTHLHST